MTSLPSRERGLKYKNNPFFKLGAAVAPLAGAWVEISSKRYKTIGRNVVAPLAGAWVEIGTQVAQNLSIMVAPLAGAWVEIIF